MAGTWITSAVNAPLAVCIAGVDPLPALLFSLGAGRMPMDGEDEAAREWPVEVDSGVPGGGRLTTPDSRAGGDTLTAK
jgi:hypothetical protein